MIRVVVVGCGFGGLAALKELSRYAYKLRMKVIAVDRKETFDFLPMLPDVIGAKIRPEHLSYNIQGLLAGWGYDFIRGTVSGIDLDDKSVVVNSFKVGFDYLIIANGSETNFYGNADAEANAYKLDDVEDAKKILSTINEHRFGRYVIAGGGYTGVETAVNLKRYLSKKNDKSEVLIVERASSILGPLPEKLKAYTLSNLDRLGIRVTLDATIAEVSSDSVRLSNGEMLPGSMLIWSAGVKTGNFVQKLGWVKSPQGRLKVDEYLRIEKGCFAIGDAANFEYEGKPLRMAVQFALAQGETAAVNIVNNEKQLPLKPFKPVDLGYIVPMANNRSCGLVFGRYLFGLPATMAHYAMCIYRTPSLKNKIGLLNDLIIGP